MRDAPSRLELVAIGYADGYPRGFADGTPVMVGRQHSRILGLVSMAMMSVNLTPAAL